tara:strand:+ start:911 stop:1864 length:954 start_codon:yes stop_codon:yes gene_type:complete
MLSTLDEPQPSRYCLEADFGGQGVDPAIVVNYAPSGYGKSLDALYSAPTGLFLTPAPGGLVAARSMLGVTVREERVQSIPHACTVLQKAGKVDALVLDDFSILAERSYLALDTSGNNKNPWEAWMKLRKEVLNLRELCIAGGTTLVLTAHEKPPDNSNGTFMPGGPKMPSKHLTTALPHIATLVLRGVKDSFIQPPEWIGRYNCDPSDTRWITKDRYCVVGKQCPMNLREILVRAKEVGHSVAVPPRAPGLEWLDEAAEAVAENMANGGTSQDSASKLTAHAKGVDPRHLRWAWRDGLARHTLRIQGHSELFGMFVS